MSRKLTRKARFRIQVGNRANTLYHTLRKRGTSPEEALRQHDDYMASWKVPLVPEVVARLASRASLNPSIERIPHVSHS